MPKGGLEPPRVTSHAPQTCASTSSATSARKGRESDVRFTLLCERQAEIYRTFAQHPGYFFFVGAGDGVKTVEVGTATGAVGVAAGVGTASCSGTPDCKTDLVPVTIGRDSTKANNMKPMAAPIVIFDSSVCVPRGPNAVLDTELENSAPASAFPGCSKTVTTRMMHDKINSP